MDKELSEERLFADWSLTSEDIWEIEKCRGQLNRRWFAVQLCHLRKEGRFLETASDFPLKIINFVSAQLGLSPVLWLNDPGREATASHYRTRIQHHLGIRELSEELEHGLRKILKQEAVAGKNERDLQQTAEVFLRERKVLLPPAKFFGKLIRESLLFAQADVYEEIAGLLSEETGAELESLLETENKRSKLFELKEYPPKASASAILNYIDKYSFVSGLTRGRIELQKINPNVVRNLAGICKRYNVWQLRRFPEPKRRALLACFLSETEKLLLDYLVEMHDQFLLEMIRHTKHSFEEKTKKAKRQVRSSVATLTEAVGFLLEEAADGIEKNDAENLLNEFFAKFNAANLTQAVAGCREWREIEEQGYLQEIRHYFPALGKYFYRFAGLPFSAAAGSEYLLEALAVVQKLKDGKIKEIPENAGFKFVPPTWRKGLFIKKSRHRTILDRRLWLTALALAVRDALRAGTLYLPNSRRYVSFWELVYQENEWQKERETSYQILSLEQDTSNLFACLKGEFKEVLEQFSRSLPTNKFVVLENGKIRLKKEDALPIPEKVKKLRKVIESAMPRIRIEDLLAQVDYLTQFSSLFRSPPEMRESSAQLKKTKLAALIAHGTNLGLSTMAGSTEKITVEMLQHVSRHYLTETTLKDANTRLVNYHHGLRMSSLWGDAATSSSDGQRFGVQASSLIASYYPRYFGYYEKALTVYTHLSNQYSVFSTRVISCQPREALYVLDGLLENETDLQPREHYTDTHGFTEQLFGLCYLLGFSFMPRLKDIADQQLYKISKTEDYG